MSESDQFVELVGEICYRHRNAETHAEWIGMLVLVGAFPPDIIGKRPRGPCSAKRRERNRCIVEAIDILRRDGLSLRAAYERLGSVVPLGEKTIETVYRAKG